MLRCQFDLQIQHNPTQIPSKLFYGYQQADSKVYMEKWKIQNSQHSIKGKQSQRSDTTQTWDTPLSHSIQDYMILAKEKVNRSME